MRMCVVRRLSAAALTVAMTVGLPALARAQDPAKTAIDAANKKFVAAFTKQDAAAVAATYTPDGNAFPPNSPIVKGRAAIMAKIEKGLAPVSSTTFLHTEPHHHAHTLHNAAAFTHGTPQAIRNQGMGLGLASAQERAVPPPGLPPYAFCGSLPGWA